MAVERNPSDGGGSGGGAAVFYLDYPLRFHLVKIILLVLVLVVTEQQAMVHMQSR